MARAEEGHIMRFSLIALLILAFAAVAHSQIPGAVSSEPNPNLQVVNAKWQKYNPPADDSVDFWHTNPFRYTSGGSHLPLNFIARLLVKNTSAKTITGFDVDYLFLDAAGAEFLRYGFHASVDIRPGKEKQLKQKVQQLGRHRERYTPIKPDDEQLLKSRFSMTRLIVRRLEYADGTVWERP